MITFLTIQILMSIPFFVSIHQKQDTTLMIINTLDVTSSFVISFVTTLYSNEVFLIGRIIGYTFFSNLYLYIIGRAY